jgi:hypothetical protein
VPALVSTGSGTAVSMHITTNSRLFRRAPRSYTAHTSWRVIARSSSMTNHDASIVDETRVTLGYPA